MTCGADPANDISALNAIPHANEIEFIVAVKHFAPVCELNDDGIAVPALWAALNNHAVFDRSDR